MATQLPDRSHENVVALIREHFREERAASAVNNAKEFAAQLTGIGVSRVVPAFCELLGDPSYFVRLQAAWWLRLLRHNVPSAVRKEQDTQAIHVFENAVQQANRDERMFALFMLGREGSPSVQLPPVPKQVVPPLLSILNGADSAQRVFSAVALAGSDEEEVCLQVLRFLTPIMQSDDAELSVMAANGLARLRLRLDEVVAVLVRQLKEGNPSRQMTVLSALTTMGVNALAAIPELIELHQNESTHDDVRDGIASAMGKICSTESDAEPVRHISAREKVRAMLLDDARSNGSSIQWGAIDGLLATGGLPKDLIQRIMPLLDHENDETRGAALFALVSAGPDLVVAVPKLVERLLLEPSPAIRDLTMNAVAAAGAAAVPALVEIVRQQNQNTILIAAEALIRIGQNAVPAIAEAMLSDRDEVIRETGVGILQRLGPRAEAAVPAATQLLDHLDSGVREHAAMALLFMGNGAKAAIPSLIQALSDDQRDISHWAEKTLVNIGPDAVPLLRNAAPGDELGRFRIARLIEQFSGTGVSSTADGFEWVGNDDLLVLFAWVGQRLLNEPVSLRSLAIELHGFYKSGKWKHRLPSSKNDSTLRDWIGRLQDILGRGMNQDIELLQKDGQKTKGLTDEGKELLSKIMTYLRKKGLLIVPGQEPGSRLT